MIFLKMLPGTRGFWGILSFFALVAILVVVINLIDRVRNEDEIVEESKFENHLLTFFTFLGIDEIFKNIFKK